MPPEFDANVIRNMVVVFFLNNLDQYKVTVKTKIVCIRTNMLQCDGAYLYEYMSFEMIIL